MGRRASHDLRTQHCSGYLTTYCEGDPDRRFFGVVQPFPAVSCQLSVINHIMLPRRTQCCDASVKHFDASSKQHGRGMFTNRITALNGVFKRFDTSLCCSSATGRIPAILFRCVYAPKLHNDSVLRLVFFSQRFSLLTLVQRTVRAVPLSGNVLLDHGRHPGSE